MAYSMNKPGLDTVLELLNLLPYDTKEHGLVLKVYGTVDTFRLKEK
jgi:hypothetical protein